jgi:hypothetical protein
MNYALAFWIVMLVAFLASGACAIRKEASFGACWSWVGFILFVLIGLELFGPAVHK